ncbi:DUF2461 domain-containing protein [Pollutibacter soli]|uniref:DUF2461 domain-containing protein n=1 Tax=Pollutibacter soli TaxID=3034157 RepID=UPI0030139F4C
MLQTSSIRFLKELKKNNNKSWFDAHRPAYEAARKDFELFIQQLIDLTGKKDPELAGIKAKECLFRINRDVRFSKDKSPYKSNFGASINRGGKKSIFGGYYFHFEPGNSFIGGGLWAPMPQELQKVRQEIDYCFDEFSKLVNAKKFKDVYNGLDFSSESSLSRVPRGYEPDNPAAKYIKLKNFIAMRKVSDKELQSPELLKESANTLLTLTPVIKFINRAIEH